MLRVYLDENKWMELSRARHSRPGGEHAADALRVVTEASARRLASFPLSLTHYIENWNHADSSRRLRLAQTKLEISRGDRIAPNVAVVQSEVDESVHQLYGQLVAAAQPPAVFGAGLGHVTGHADWADLAARLELDGVPPAYRNAIKSTVVDIADMALLAGPNLAVRTEFVTGADELGQRYVQGEQRLQEEIRRQGLSGVRRDIAIAGWAIADIREPIESAFHRIGRSADSIFEDPKLAELLQLLVSIPSRWGDFQFLRLRHQNPALPRKSSDLNDVAALSVAFAYCDVVVTERSWTHFATLADFETQFGTKVLHDLNDLIPLLLTTS